MNIDLRHLRNFLAVAEERGFSAAGRRLHLAQPTITRSIRMLEEALGVRLFERSTRRIDLTPKGARLRDSLAPLVQQLDSALDDVRQGETLRVGFTWVLPEGIAALAAGFAEETGTKVELVRCDAAMAGLDTGDVDVALLRGEVSTNGVRGVLLCEEERLAAVSASSPLARRKTLDWAELAQWRLIVNTVSGTTFPEMWPVGGRPKVGAECRNFDEWLEKIAGGGVFGTAPASAARRYTHPDVRLIPLRGAPLVPTYLAYPVHGYHPLAARFADVAWRASRTVKGKARQAG
ncbi:LysR family transcriptional regulator [Streptomyces sp. NPDC101227]|uniref:LysR family transcriptional regulator n=1 Tax=Streptomyces sp. NPDC101227 TaxID=3366136 RepID=UPI0038298903